MNIVALSAALTFSFFSVFILAYNLGHDVDGDGIQMFLIIASALAAIGFFVVTFPGH
jgi:hypothetical protein